jgi:hypothetical protein
MRSRRLAAISASRSRARRSTRRLGHLRQACSCCFPEFRCVAGSGVVRLANSWRSRCCSGGACVQSSRWCRWGSMTVRCAVCDRLALRLRLSFSTVRVCRARAKTSLAER